MVSEEIDAIEVAAHRYSPPAGSPARMHLSNMSITFPQSFPSVNAGIAVHHVNQPAEPSMLL
jgi:hypothetical protein